MPPLPALTARAALASVPYGIVLVELKTEYFERQFPVNSSTLCTKYKHTPTAYKAGCYTTDASAAWMSGGVAAATWISSTGEGPVGKVPLPNGGEGGTAGVWPAKGAR